MVVLNKFGERYYENPVRAFLTCLNDYGVEITIDGKRKKLFNKITIPKDRNKGEIMKGHYVEGEPMYLSVAQKIDKNHSVYIEFAYGINVHKYSEELKKLRSG